MTFFLVVTSAVESRHRSSRWRFFAVSRRSCRLWCAYEAAQSTDQACPGSMPPSFQKASIGGSCRAIIRASPQFAANETYGGRLIASCSRGHSAVCRCCNPCPKNRGLRERLARRRQFASHSPSPSARPEPEQAYSRTVGPSSSWREIIPRIQPAFFRYYGANATGVKMRLVSVSEFETRSVLVCLTKSWNKK
jgi:hypothetical protein